MSVDFSLVVHALGSVMSFFIIGWIGYFLAKRKWFSADSKFLISKLITLVALPPFLLYNINSVISKNELRALAFGIPPAMISILIMIGLSLLIAWQLAIPWGRRGSFCTSFAFSNTIYIGLPVNMALFGAVALPYVLIYYFANTIFFWSIGNYLLASDGPADTVKQSRIFSLETLGKIISPPMYGFLTGLLLLLLDLKLPEVLASTARSLGSMVTPLVVISIGVTLYDLGLSKIRFTRDLVLILLGRFVLSPLSIILITYFFPLPDLMRKVFIIQASLPAMSSVAIMAAYYRSDVEYATVSVSATTLAAIVTVPFFMVVANQVV